VIIPLIELKNISQTREKRDVLKDVSLSIDRGEVFALIGPTGAGKTTLLRVIDLLDKPSRGQIYYNGADVDSSEKYRLEIRRRMAFVLQKPVVFNNSVYENVAYGLKWRGIHKHDIREKVNAVLEATQLNDYSPRNARTLSGGEMQRVAIARAMVTNPEVLLLDEPSANLDPVSAAKIEDILKNIIREYSVTVIMATHDMAQGQRLADRIGVLFNGEIVQVGHSSDIFYRPASRKIAEFVGMENIIDGVVITNEGDMTTVDVNGRMIEAVTEYSAGEEVTVGVRPEDVTVALEKLSSSARNSLEGTITRTVSNGPLCRVEIDCGFLLVALITRRSAEEMGLEKGTTVFSNFKAVSIHVIKRR
jgi:tungstate transport system ATP-binding protein